MSVRTIGKQIGGIVAVATGTYTGNGAATQAIIGIGFQPKYVIIWAQEARGLPVNQDIVHKTDQDGVNAKFLDCNTGRWRYLADMIISLDADGFTVGDGTPLGVDVTNTGGVDFSYVAYS